VYYSAASVRRSVTRCWHPRLKCDYLELYSKENSIVSRVSFSPGSYFHCLAASRAAPANNGLPPTRRVFLTLPSDETVTSIFTFPLSWYCRASSGYLASTFVLILRVIACWLDSCENADGCEDSVPKTSNSKPTLKSRNRTVGLLRRQSCGGLHLPTVKA
jgi:hypothetical protein